MICEFQIQGDALNIDIISTFLQIFCFIFIGYDILLIFMQNYE